MFSDSKIASSFQLSETKCGYFITYGIASHFKEPLLKDVNLSPFLVFSFDESLNEVFQKEQMDLQIRYWDNTQGILARISCNVQIPRTYVMF